MITDLNVSTPLQKDFEHFGAVILCSWEDGRVPILGSDVGVSTSIQQHLAWYWGVVILQNKPWSEQGPRKEHADHTVKLDQSANSALYDGGFDSRALVVRGGVVISQR